MAISFTNVITKGYSGKVGDIVLRNYGGKSVMAKRPDYSKVIKTARQLEFMNKFAKAVKYGLFVKDNPALCEYYRKKRPDLSPYHAAISDYQSSPVIEHIDVSEYHGYPGDVVTVSAWDKWNIEGVGVVIFNALGDVIEFGEAVPREFSGGMEWDYKATKENLDYHGGKVIVSVRDKPGNVVQSSVVFNGSS
ncbi:MAG: hypothetical protein ABSD71_06115 [Bacteroidales bacterium]|jgi:hypothetical protein